VTIAKVLRLKYATVGKTAQLSSTTVLIVAAMANPAKSSALPDHVKPGAPPAEVSAMNSVTFGQNSKLTVLPAERDRVRAFYRDLLGCPMTKTSDRADFFKIGDTFYLGVIYDDKAQSAKDRAHSIWLELRTGHPEQLKRKILDFGIAEIPYWDKEHFYFQAPGGQIFRLVGTSEDMSKWQH